MEFSHAGTWHQQHVTVRGTTYMALDHTQKDLKGSSPRQSNWNCNYKRSVFLLALKASAAGAKDLAAASLCLKRAVLVLSGRSWGTCGKPLFACFCFMTLKTD